VLIPYVEGRRLGVRLDPPRLNGRGVMRERKVVEGVAGLPRCRRVVKVEAEILCSFHMSRGD